MVNELQLLLQQQARKQQLEINERRREKHLPVVFALRDPRQAPSIIAEASAQIRLWRVGHLCSADYIQEWESLLKDPSRAAALLEERSSKAAQLRQNSPFVAAVRRFKAAHVTPILKGKTPKQD